MKIHGTAKGGALSTKDFGVAFGSPAAPATYTLIWENTSGGSPDDAQGEIYFANEFDTNDDVIGEAITKITVRVKKTGSPTATITGYLWLSATNLGDNPSVTSAETFTAGDVGTDMTTLTFTFTNTTNTAQGYKAGFAFSAVGDGSNHYNIDRVLGGAVDGTYGCKAKDLTNPTWLFPDSKATCNTQGVYKSP